MIGWRETDLERGNSMSWNWQGDYFFHHNQQLKKITCIDVRRRRVAFERDGDSCIFVKDLDIILIRNGNEFEGIQLASGRSLWTATTGQFRGWPTVSGRRFFYTDGTDFLARDVKTGKELWKKRLENGFSNVSLQPITR